MIQGRIERSSVGVAVVVAKKINESNTYQCHDLQTCGGRIPDRIGI